MKPFKWIIFVAALALIIATGATLARLKARQRLGNPGVILVNIPNVDSRGKNVSQQSVQLPETFAGCEATRLPIADTELSSLPADTTFGKRFYRWPDNFQVDLSVVLMGTDRTSIHQPQFCLVGQGWGIDQTEPISIPIARPVAYEIPALKLTTSIRAKDERGKAVTMRGIYIYWFVTENKLTSAQGDRMWSMAKTLLQTGVLERWAYVSYFSTCLPGQEQKTFERLKNFIADSVPEFQPAPGQSAKQLSSAKNEKIGSLH